MLTFCGYLVYDDFSEAVEYISVARSIRLAYVV